MEKIYWPRVWYRTKNLAYECTFGAWHNIKRIIKWVPILWNSYDFDYGYLNDLIIFKLKLMIELFEDDTRAFTVQSAKHAKEMRRVVWLLEHAEMADIDQYRDQSKRDYSDYFGVPFGVIKRTRKDQEYRYIREAYRRMGKSIMGWWD